MSGEDAGVYFLLTADEQIATCGRLASVPHATTRFKCYRTKENDEWQN